LEAPAFYFVGATTPARRPASQMRATGLAAEAASAAAAWAIIDTTGLISGELGQSLKSAKIKRLRPVHVLAIGDSPDLDPILDPWQDDPQVVAHRIPRPPAAKDKPRADRAQWRHQGFADWLMGSNLRWIAPEGRTFTHPPATELFAHSPEMAGQLKGLLMGFSEESGRGLCVGLLHSVDWATGRVLALCPAEGESAPVVDFGCIRLEPDGTQVT
jgi:polynucleotide 5'-kinase involved in rRNA processing